MKNHELEISEQDIMQQLEQLRAEGDPRERRFTLEQDQALWHARVTMTPPLPYRHLKRWWADRWGPVNDGTLRKRVDRLRAQGGPQ